MPHQDLESKLLEDVKQGKEVHLERALLILSGLKNEEEIAGYVRKIDQLEEGFKDYEKSKRNVIAHKELHGAILLFEYLWDKKPKRYNNNFFLTNVIDAQLSYNKNKKVGNCVGLTSLYTVLGLRTGLKPLILHLPGHIKNRLIIGKRKYDIENTSPFGFNPKVSNSIGNSIHHLLYDVLDSRGIAKVNSGDIKGAIQDYNKAIEINPEFSQTYNHRGIAKSKSGNIKGAIQDFNKAIEINPEYSPAYNNRGNIKYEIGDLAGAIRDYDAAIEIDPEFSQAYNNRGRAKHKLGDLDGAIKDYDKEKRILNKQ